MNKITKLLSVFIIAGAIGTGIAGVAGCKGGGDDGDNGGGGGGDCQHTTLSYQDNQDGATHKVICDDCQETIDASASHTDADHDEACDDCHGNVSSQSSNVTVTIDSTVDSSVVAGGTVQLSATVSGADTYTVEWEITTGGTLATISGNTLTAGTTAGDVIIVAKVKVDGVLKATSDPKTINIRALSKYDELKASADKIYNNEFETAADTLPAFTAFGTAGIYEYNATETSHTKVEDGVAKLQKTAAGETVAIVDFGTSIKDIIEGYVEVTIKQETGTNWSFLRILKAGSTPSEIFSLRTGTANVIQYRVNGGANIPAEKKTGEQDVAANVDATLKVYFKYNTVTQKLNVTVNDTTIVDNTVDLSEARGMGFYSSNSNMRTVWVDNLVICSSALSDTEYVDAVKGNVTAYNTAAVALKGNAWTSDATEGALDAALATANTALNAQDVTRTAANVAYATYTNGVHTALSTEYLERLQAAYPAADYNTGEGSAYDTAIANAATAFNAVNTLEGFATTYAAQNDLLAAVPTKADESHALVVLKVVYVNGDEQEVTIGTVNKNATNGDLRDADTITLDSIKAACTAPAGKYVAKVYNADKTAEVGASYVVDQTAGTEKTEAEVTYYEIKLCAVLGDKASITADGLSQDSTSKAFTAKEGAAIPDGITLNEGLSLKADTTLKDTHGYENTINTNGNTGTANRSITITITRACTVKVIFAANGTDGRKAAIRLDQTNPSPSGNDKEDNLVILNSTAKTDVKELTYHFTVNEGEGANNTYYVAFNASCNVYEIVIEYDAE